MSQLTIPTAGIDPGRSADVRVQASDAGASVAQFGNVMADVGAKLETDRLQREMNRLGVDLTRDMNNLSLEMAQIGDPDTLETTFQSRIAELRKTYINGATETGRPRVDPRNAEQFNLAFDELRNRHELNIGQQALAGKFAQREATYFDYVHTATAAAATADPETRDAYFEQGSKQIDELEAAGVIDAAEAQKRRLSLQSGMDAAAALRMLDEDPNDFLDALDAGEFSGLDGEEQSRFRVSANAKIAAADAKAVKDAEIAASTAEKAVTDRLKQMAGIWSLGQRSADEDAFLARADVQANPYFSEAMAQRELLIEKPQLDMMTPAQLQDAVDEEKNRPKVYKYQAERLALLETKLDAEEKAWAADPIAHAREKGLPVPELPEFDPTNPQEFGAALSQFRGTSAALVKNGWTETDAVFDQATTKQLRKTISDTKDPDARATLAGVVAATLGDRPDVMDLVSDDPVFRWVGGLMNAKGSQAIASEIMVGQQTIDAGTVILPPAKDRLQPTFDVVEDLFVDIPGGADIQAQAMAAADALYAARSGRVDPAGNIDEKLYQQSLHEVLGGTGSYDSRGAAGGLQQVNDELTMLPQGVKAQQVETALSRIGVVRTTETKRPSFTTDQDQLTTNLAAISTSGRPPLINGSAITEDTLAQMNLRAVGDGVYEFFYTSNSGQILVPETEDGERYQFSMSKLLK
ncbi:hypothetical protein [Roseobacter sp. TSBP12]|uniref:hypothetical protein n=1 Tax=Roseobacter sp. TSBP12 TaxID=1236613 RepID=UPI0012600AC6|nr:hypothetical protein [Roseobacter sp. TSBP12]KAB6717706.1 hypothetical protein C8029_04085 [Roseobacter sp. TSBP12]